MSQVQTELTEMSHRYTMLGTKLTDRQSELDVTREELRKQLEHLKQLAQFLDKVQRSLPKESVPNSKEDADKTGKLLKVKRIILSEK